MPKRYPLYELSLRLYPKQFQRRYSRQMVQTMADMLENQPNKTARGLLWIRTGLNLAYTIVQENITNLGENNVNKPTLTKPLFTYKRLSIVLAAIILLMVGALHTRIQANIAPVLAKPFYMKSVKTTMLDQSAALKGPMVLLYGESPGGVPKEKNNCNAGTVQGIHTQVICQSTLDGYTKLPQDAAGKQRVTTNVQVIEAALKANGYTAGSNDVTLTSLVMGTYEGKSNSPDAFYEKVTGDYDCIFDTNVAYSDPKPAAIHSSFSCARTVNVLGAPSQAVYQSNRGFMAN